MSNSRRFLVVGGLLIAAVLVPSFVFAARIVMRDGRILQGRATTISTTVENPQSPAEGKSIILVNDGLREIFVPASPKQVQEVNERDADEQVERFIIPQQVCVGGSQFASVGRIVKITPFDVFGHRSIEMQTNRGIEAVLQGVTEITPEWTKLECIQTNNLRFTWDMRIATNTIPRDTLAVILSKQIDQKNIEDRLKVVRLYIQSQRFKDAEDELGSILQAFPDQQARFQQMVVLLHQMHARRGLEEIEKRMAAGQHQLTMSLLQNFPAEKVAGEVLQRVREMLDDYKKQEERRLLAIRRLEELLEQVKDTATKLRAVEVVKEIKAELSLNTLERMAAFLLFEAEPTMAVDDKVGLAISGWLVGTDYAIRNLPTALSMFDSRNLMRKYLVETIVIERKNLLEALRKQEGFSPELTARLLAVMKPPVDTPAPPPPPAPADGVKPEPPVVGFHKLVVDSMSGEPPVEYLVQLPPEYDPHRRYPMIFSLHGAGSTPALQIEWWAGGVGPDGVRYGHAGRNGYIVVAPQWSKEQQISCNYADYEHAAVLKTLRDVFRRFAVDTDRVFLTGHSMGGDAAWDIALAHPDLWAGFIGITPIAEKTATFNWENAAYVPTYLVCGEKDGMRWVTNGIQMDRFLSRGFDTTIVRYIGRGHEHFSDETIRLFDWMNRRKRDFFPKAFKCRSVRPFDNFFWWIETDDPPPGAMVEVDNWPPKNVTLFYVEGKMTVNAKNGTNNLNVTTNAGHITIWLSPELVDFKQPCDVYVKGSRLNKTRFIEPDAGVILEDARGRCDRQHPFWAKLEAGK